MTGGPKIHGDCDPAFARVRRVFENNFARDLETGAAISVYVGDEPVVDLWGGLADHRTGRAWERDTPCLAFSCTKALTAAAALRVAERGGHDLSAPVASWWPEFGTAGKERTTGEHLLSHQAGLPVFDRPVSVAEAADPAAMADLLAAQRPRWEPGTAHGYHTFSYGWLAGEIVRRLDGRSVGAYVAEEIAGPLGLDLWIGAPDDVIDRAARLTAGPGRGGAPAQAPAGGPVAALARAARDPGSLLSRSLAAPDVDALPGRFNSREVLAAGWPAAGVLTSAAALAGFYRDLLAGRIVSPGTLRDAITPRVTGPDRVMVLDSSFGLGFMRPSLVFAVPRAAWPGAFGHTGSGGSIGLADVEHGVAIAYVMNRTGTELSGGTRAMRLVKAVYDSLD
ncbi:serine hydrolase domain-containing protein [Marinitenerispora sediminis]|uniref:Esterase n=1 Tax=Marinitenerispora sediminis TaxID=1931232 RepID=A0A368T5N0_9ACTN|nr:serine hydrolase domain-containing protein [Marinitenerispora sediminis]RCV53307.1 esterase [Marinitenerispora sediminis]RCV58523.1 esterase [Marinitenerispora sediminis]RCV58860.1 esterase [Marinitenerispora sediminis]